MLYVTVPDGNNFASPYRLLLTKEHIFTHDLSIFPIVKEPRIWPIKTREWSISKTESQKLCRCDIATGIKRFTDNHLTFPASVKHPNNGIRIVFCYSH